ncbi:hypothetical protein BUALT_Bualt06G0030800 [Buddleja alternifolia]|uniref:phytol kinase n=1 Tax=Buddleja alternifolia TaxID=168488 RepID=A0AAV6XGT8_9LAMI|nr:hypothetical protein BUALT_Bualt06G0030800 [Buddleja alternifolia]
MAYGAIMNLGAPASSLSSSPAHLFRRHVVTPSSSTLPILLTTALPKNILIKPRQLRRHSSAAAAGIGGDVLQDAGATLLVIGGAYALVSTFDNLTRRNIIEQISKSTGARYFASLVPSINCLRLVINGLSLTTDEGLVKSVSREGKPEELLRGPLYYVLVLIVSAIVFWRESPVGMISLAMMCGGDGIADIMGRKFGFRKLPYNQQKSWAGSISMFLFSFLVSVGMLYYFTVFGYIQLEWMSTIERVALVSFVATVIESLPITGIVDDNISVPLVSMVSAFLIFGY